jgi:hypothetical protein
MALPALLVELRLFLVRIKKSNPAATGAKIPWLFCLKADKGRGCFPGAFYFSLKGGEMGRLRKVEFGY